MNEPEPTKAQKPESPTGQEETTDQDERATAEFESGASAVSAIKEQPS